MGRSLRAYHEIAKLRWEPEHARLLRAVSSSRENAPDWSYEFDAEKSKEAASIVATWPGKKHFLALSIGAKLPDKIGGQNWMSVLNQLATYDLHLGSSHRGGAREGSMGSLLADWPGPVLNLCGDTSPVTSAVMTEAKFYLGHDSGPMHLARLSDPMCCVFSARAKPGVWFPHGKGMRCSTLARGRQCSAKNRFANGWGSIMSITVEDVIGACKRFSHVRDSGSAGRSPFN